MGDTIKVSSRTTPRIPTACIRTACCYEKDSEGADYNDGTSGEDKEDGCVAPGATHTYIWRVPDRAGPGPNDPSSLFWLYHSHCDELRDVASGLFGGIVITRRGMALPDGRPKDVDHEFVTIFIAINENESWYLDDNIKRAHHRSPKRQPDEVHPSLSTGIFGTVAGTGFVRHQRQVVHQRLHLRQHAHDGHEERRSRALVRGHSRRLQQRAHAPLARQYRHRRRPAHRCDLGRLRADGHRRHGARRPGIWLYHCHISDHMLAGMTARYEVTNR